MKKTHYDKNWAFQTEYLVLVVNNNAHQYSLWKG